VELASIKPAVPAGTIAAAARTDPSGEVRVDTFGCVCPAGHTVKEPTFPVLGTPADGSVRKVIPFPVDVYNPFAVAVAEDGSVWTAGEPKKKASDHNIFWHFDSVGNKIGSAVDINSFSSSRAIHDHSLFSASPHGLIFVCQKDGRYIELSLDGAVTTDIPVQFPGTATGSFVAAVAATEDGQRFVAVEFPQGPQSPQPPHSAIYSVDRKSGNLAVAADSPDFGLLGADRNTLVALFNDGLGSVNIVP